MEKAAAAAYVDDGNSWDSFGLDPRLLQAIDHLGFKNPTLIQSSALPLALDEKRDIIAKSSTGSGKTAAYCLPILQNILSEENSGAKCVKAIILVPTKELSNQVTQFVEKLLIYCNHKVSSLNLSSDVSLSVIESLLAGKPDVIVSTPSKLISTLKANVKSNLIDLKTVKSLVIDEVDLVLSYGYMDDLAHLGDYLPIKSNLQTYLMSATISDELDDLKTRFCSKPAVLKLNEENLAKENLVQYYARTTEFDKFLLAYVIFKLGLIRGKSLVFVNTIDRGYRLKLFLEQFGIRCCVLNSELPVNSRIHIVDEFNKNVYNLLIAADDMNDSTLEHGEEESEQEDEEVKVEEDNTKVKADEDNVEVKSEEETNPQVKSEDAPEMEQVENKKKSKKSKKEKKSKKDKEYGVSRGVDFRNVACVLNFDMPTTARAYVHRIGRTARAGKAGMALSFVVPKKELGKNKIAGSGGPKKDEKVLKRVESQQAKSGFELKVYEFDMKQVDGFRYRADDAFRAVTGSAIREARIAELRNELINSDKLKRYFEENPQDLASLKHDRVLHPARVQEQLKRVPDYLLPPGARTETTKNLGDVSLKKRKVSKFHKRRKGNKMDPLKGALRR